MGEGIPGAFFMGLTMGIVAAPCIGPIVVALLLFVGARQSVALGFALFFTLAVGMGTPYVALAAAAGRFRRLPRAGAWLEWIERAFAFLLLGLAVYFLAPLLRPATVRAAYAFVGVAAGIVLGFLSGGGRRTARWSRQLAGLVLVGVSLGWLISVDAGSPIECGGVAAGAPPGRAPPGRNPTPVVEKSSIVRSPSGAPNARRASSTRAAFAAVASIQTSRSFVARGWPWTPTAYAPTTRKRASAA